MLLSNLPDCLRTKFKDLPEDVQFSLCLYLTLVEGWEIIPDSLEVEITDNHVRWFARVVSPHAQAYIKVE